jgi:hypothetical protein
LKNDISSKYIFHLRWKSRTYDDRHRIFADYDDYKNLEDFYKMSRVRDREFMNNKTSSDSVLKINEAFLLISENIISNVDWSKHSEIKSEISKKDSLLPIPLIVLTSVFTVYACEGLPWVLWQREIGLVGFFIVILSMVLARTLTSFFVSRALRKNSLLNITTANMIPNSTRSIQTRKLLPSALLIMGTPDILLVIVIGNLLAVFLGGRSIQAKCLLKEEAEMFFPDGG